MLAVLSRSSGGWLLQEMVPNLGNPALACLGFGAVLWMFVVEQTVGVAALYTPTLWTSMVK